MLTDKELQVLLLRERGLLQVEIARRLGITQGAVSRFEANARKKAREALTSLEILRHLGIELGERPVGSKDRAKEIERLLGGGR